MPRNTSFAISKAGSKKSPARPHGGFANGKQASRNAFSKFAHLRYPQLGPPKGQLPPFTGSNGVLLAPTVDYGQYFTNFSATGAFTVGAGLASGLSIDADTGVISGTPTTQALTTVTLTVTDDLGGSVSVDFDHTIVV